MALYHLHLKQISRKNKTGGSKSAAAVVAYRERAKIDEHDYRRKGGFLRSYTLIPMEFQGSELAEILSTPEGFAAETEKVEKRKDAQLWDELEISLQKELTLDENMELLNKLIAESYTVRNQPVRVFIHHPENSDNIHAHVLIIQRPLQKGENGAVELGKKIRQDFTKGKPQNADRLVLMRSRWSSLVNNAFAEKNIDLTITHESLKKQHEKALLAGDLEKAAETDRPALYLPKTARKDLTEVIVADNNDYDFVANQQHLANVTKAKNIGIENLTIDFWVNATSFWANAKKIKTNFRIARRKQREKIRKIIKENLENAIKYAIKSFEIRATTGSPTVEKLNAHLRSSVRNDQINSFKIAKQIASVEATDNTRGSTFYDSRPGKDINHTGKTTNESVRSSGSVIGNYSSGNFSNTTRSTIDNRIRTSSYNNTDDELKMIIDKSIEARFNKQNTPPRRRI